jgi:OOP family OmpA-OmpF porin
MLKIITLYLLGMLSMVYANNIESEIGINIGLNATKNEKGNKFKNPTVGLMYQNNKYMVAPRVDLEYTDVKADFASSLVKASVNGVYEYENSTVVTPYALAGVGYEYVSGATKDVFENNFFVQGGGGLKFDLGKEFKARTEGKVLQIVGSDHDEGNEFILTAGVSMILNGNATPKVRKVPRIPVAQPKVIQPIKVVHSNNNECPIKIAQPDMDRDGVTDRVDQCPATPCSFTVDQYGCPIKTRLKINFDTNSYVIRMSSRPQVNQFANFLLQNKGSMVTITGHTDSVGSATKNLTLSQQRANAVMHALINQGVSASRLQALGKGESMPVASNATVSGKAMNRRIEAELFYPKGGR